MAAKKTSLTYRLPNGSIYKIQYRETKDGYFGPAFYRMKVIQHPPCSYQTGVSAHLLEANFICVAEGREPDTIERAKAVALHWMTGFESYRRHGVFPNGQSRFDVKEV